MYQKIKTIKKIRIQYFYIIFVLFFTSNCADKKAEFYNPIGCSYDAVIEYFEENDFEYMRLITDLNDVCLMYYDNLYTRQSCFIFNDEYICYKSIFIILSHEYGDVKCWLNENCQRIPDDSMKWEDRKKDLIYIMKERGDGGAYILTSTFANPKTAHNSEINRVVLNYYSARVYDPSANEITEWSESYHRFVVPLSDNGEVNGNIVHFKPRRKMLTYKKKDKKSDEMNIEGTEGKVVYVLNDKDDECLFYLANDLSLVSIFDTSFKECEKGVWIEFSNIKGQQNQFILVTNTD